MDTLVNGILLAGGQSRRFGTPKAFATFQGKHYFRYSLHALGAISKQTWIVSHPTLTARFKQNHVHTVIEDVKKYQGCGPLAGIYSVMKMTDATWYATAPCDTPNIQGEVYKILFSYIKNDFDAMIPIIGERRQPLIALYHRSCLPIIEQLLHEKLYKVGALLDQVNTCFINDPNLTQHPEWFMNINDAGEQRILEEQVKKDK